MRIGIDASNLRAGGGVTHLREILEAVNPDEHEFSAITVWGPTATLNQIRCEKPWLNLVTDRWLNGSGAMRMYWRSFRLPRLARQASDLLFAPGGLLPRIDIPTVTMCRNLLPFSPEEKKRYGWSANRLKFELLRIGQLSSFRRATGLIFLTRFARDIVSQQIDLVEKNTVIVPHGISARFFSEPRPQQALETFSPSNPIQLLYVSTIHLYKHQWNVIEAVSILRKEGYPLHLELVGKAHEPGFGKMRSAQARYDPDNSFVSYSGALPFDDLHRRYIAADVFVFASSCENLPNILLEAMAAGLPIACANQGPMPEVLGDQGEYFEPDDPVSIASAVRNLLDDRQKRERLANGAHARASAYSWQQTAASTLQFLRKIGSHDTRGSRCAR